MRLSRCVAVTLNRINERLREQRNEDSEHSEPADSPPEAQNVLFVFASVFLALEQMGVRHELEVEVDTVEEEEEARHEARQSELRLDLFHVIVALGLVGCAENCGEEQAHHTQIQ